MNNLPATQQSGTAAMMPNWSDPGFINTIKATVAKGATDHEFAMFANFCKATGLNPMKREAWFIKVGEKVQIMTGINGYWQIANSHPMFDGAETGMINSNGEWVKTVAGNDFIGAWCKVYRKDRRLPMEGEALLSDYKKNSGLWTSSPRIMIKKVAQSIALRQAFSQELNGIYTAEEMPEEYSQPQHAAVTVEPRKTLYRYDITGFPVEQLEELGKYLVKAGAAQEGETVWTSTKELKKLKNYEIHEELSQ